MLRKIIKNKKAQNTVEYAILIGIVIASGMAIGMYVQRGLNANAHKAIQYMDDKTTAADPLFAAQTQYEPYYLTKDYNTQTNSVTTQELVGGANPSVSEIVTSDSAREIGGFTEQSYCETSDMNR